MLHLVVTLTLTLAAFVVPGGALHLRPDPAPQEVAGIALQEEGARSDLAHWNVSKTGLALDGYDPVAYFPAFGGAATKGSEKFTVKHRGVTYRFATEVNKAAFTKAPDAFEPQYGGWCAWAMADGKGDKVDVDPKSFVVEGGKLYLFYDGLFGDTRKRWNKGGGASKLAAVADTNWGRISAPKK